MNTCLRCSENKATVCTPCVNEIGGWHETLDIDLDEIRVAAERILKLDRAATEPPWLASYGRVETIAGIPVLDNGFVEDTEFAAESRILAPLLARAVLELAGKNNENIR
jgi:hypothetical protein